METLEDFELSLEDKPLIERVKTAYDLEQQAKSVRSTMELELCEYFKVLAKDDGHNYRTYDRFEIEEDCIRFFIEVNTACHCHPEYETREYILLFENLGKSPEQLASSLAIAKKAAAERKAKEDAEAKLIAAEKARIAKEERERKTYEELKQKFDK